MSYNFKPVSCVSYQKFVALKNVFSPKECELIVKNHFTNPKQAEIKAEAEVNKNIRDSSIKWVYADQHSLWIYRRIEEAVSETNKKHWNFQLSGIDAIQLTEYSTGGHYNWHEDIFDGMELRKLSIVVQLSKHDSYAGGNLCIFPDNVAPKEIGSAIIFPSYVTHRVSPVIMGKRHSLVAWVEGNSFI